MDRRTVFEAVVVGVGRSGLGSDRDGVQLLIVIRISGVQL